ncbi:hypothetical protein ACSQ76_10500 [Roseovarius sp. B08]|uniref:hypothetical protein n=1 Tax=Roseovarius sp. B08 TaxID=3449223 RepID=UPI003EDBEB28
MIHAAALFSSLASLALAFLIYSCHVLASRDSRLRAEWLTSIFLSLLTGLFPLSLAASVTGLWDVFSAGITLDAIIAASADLASLATLTATVIVFRSMLKANAASRAVPSNIMPLPPLGTDSHVGTTAMKDGA